MLGRGIVADPAKYRHVNTELHVIEFERAPRSRNEALQRVVPLAPLEATGEV